MHNRRRSFFICVPLRTIARNVACCIIHFKASLIHHLGCCYTCLCTTANAASPRKYKYINTKVCCSPTAGAPDFHSALRAYHVTSTLHAQCAQPCPDHPLKGCMFGCIAIERSMAITQRVEQWGHPNMQRVLHMQCGGHVTCTQDTMGVGPSSCLRAAPMCVSLFLIGGVEVGWGQRDCAVRQVGFCQRLESSRRLPTCSWGPPGCDTDGDSQCQCGKPGR